MPKRNDWRDNDPYWQTWEEVTLNDPTVNFRRTGFLEHKDFVDDYARNMDLDEQEKRQFWADYNLYMVSRRTGIKRNDEEANPFWSRWHLVADRFNWRGWRDAMGYEHGNRR